MGLDLFHVIPSKRTSDTLDYFHLDEFEDNPGFLRKYMHLAEEVDKAEGGLEIFIFPTAETKEQVLGNAGPDQDKPFLIGEIGALSTEIGRIETVHSVSGTKPLILNPADGLPAKGDAGAIPYHVLRYPAPAGKVKVLFYTEKGYQRKGMAGSFYEAFENNRLYFSKAQVIEAGRHLRPTRGQGADQLRNTFKSNFIDNFLEGESIFVASW